MPGGPFFNCYPGPFSNVRCSKEGAHSQLTGNRYGLAFQTSRHECVVCVVRAGFYEILIVSLGKMMVNEMTSEIDLEKVCLRQFYVMFHRGMRI